MIVASPQTALEKAHAAFIKYPRLDALHKKICRCQRVSKSAHEPECMALEGVTGAGKTTLVHDYYANHFKRVETPGGTVIPVLYVALPSPASVKTAISAMLEALGDPFAYNGTIASLDSRLVGLIEDCGVELVILDEFSNLIDTETDRVMAKVSDWLKMLIKRTQIPFLVVGIEGKVERILRANEQLSRLFALRETLQPFVWDYSKKESLETFNRFISTIEGCIGMKLAKSINRTDLLYRLYYATNGVVGNIMSLMRYAVTIAEEQDLRVLELPVLAQAFEERLSKHMRKGVNPFSASTDTRFVAPTPAPKPTPIVRRRARNANRIAETLSAR